MKTIFYFLTGLIICLIPNSCQTENERENKVICRLHVEIDDFSRVEPFAAISLDEITFIPDTNLVLYEIVEKERIKTDIQFEISGNKRYMHWILQDNVNKGAKRQYELVAEKNIPLSNEIPVKIEYKDGGYEFVFNGKKVLRYNSEIVQPPEGIEASYKRSGFINPLFALDQTILTRVPDSGSDHLHHYGLWNAWKKVQFRGEEIDFFAPQFGQGTVRHIGVVSKNEGHVFSSLGVLCEHITWPDTEKETLAMSDLMYIKVYNSDKDLYVIDLSFQYNPAEPFLIEEYRYAGFSFRATDFWTKDNTTIFTSEGLQRDAADSERSRWCVVTGETNNGLTSIQFMSHPGNYNHPEPMRIWPSTMNNGTGNVFINYSPTRNSNWLLFPGKTYLLRYRLLLCDGAIDATDAENAWNEYTCPPKVSWIMCD